MFSFRIGWTPEDDCFYIRIPDLRWNKHMCISFFKYLFCGLIGKTRGGRRCRSSDRWSSKFPEAPHAGLSFLRNALVRLLLQRDTALLHPCDLVASVWPLLLFCLVLEANLLRTFTQALSWFRFSQLVFIRYPCVRDSVAGMTFKVQRCR